MRHSTRCFTASKPIAPSRRASRPHPRPPRSRKVSSRRSTWTYSRDACLAHTSFEEPPRSERPRAGPSPPMARPGRGRRSSARSRAGNAAGRRSGPRCQDRRCRAITSAAAADHHLIDVAPDEHLTVAVGHGHGIVVAAVTHQRQRTRPSRALIAGIIGSRRQWQENLTIPLETLADGLLVAPQPRRLAPAALFGESIVEGPKLSARGTGTRKFRRMKPTSPSTLPLSLPLPGRPNLSSNR